LPTLVNLDNAKYDFIGKSFPSTPYGATQWSYFLSYMKQQSNIEYSLKVKAQTHIEGKHLQKFCRAIQGQGDLKVMWANWQEADGLFLIYIYIYIYIFVLKITLHQVIFKCKTSPSSCSYMRRRTRSHLMYNSLALELALEGN
jgi:hypothetical protein